MSSINYTRTVALASISALLFLVASNILIEVLNLFYDSISDEGLNFADIFMMVIELSLSVLASWIALKRIKEPKISLFQAIYFGVIYSIIVYVGHILIRIGILYLQFNNSNPLIPHYSLNQIVSDCITFLSPNLTIFSILNIVFCIAISGVLNKRKNSNNEVLDS